VRIGFLRWPRLSPLLPHQDLAHLPSSHTTNKKQQTGRMHGLGIGATLARIWETEGVRGLFK
jgi:hypothetical protein